MNTQGELVEKRREGSHYVEQFRRSDSQFVIHADPAENLMSSEHSLESSTVYLLYKSSEAAAQLLVHCYN